VFELSPERQQSVGTFTIANVNDGTGKQIQDNSEITMVFTDGDFVNGNQLKMFERWPGKFLGQIPFLNRLFVVSSGFEQITNR
jgi:hypothetical protein